MWNSPKPGDAHAAIEAELKEFEAEWPKFKSFRIQESTYDKGRGSCYC